MQPGAQQPVQQHQRRQRWWRQRALPSEVLMTKVGKLLGCRQSGHISTPAFNEASLLPTAPVSHLH